MEHSTKVETKCYLTAGALGNIKIVDNRKLSEKGKAITGKKTLVVLEKRG